MSENGRRCEVCEQRFTKKDIPDGVTIPAECCERTGLCKWCRKQGEHDCDTEDAQYATPSRDDVPRPVASPSEKWRPIDTAPKDGSPVVLATPDKRFYLVEWGKGGSWVCLRTHHYLRSLEGVAAWWMPLPQLPE